MPWRVAAGGPHPPRVWPAGLYDRGMIATRSSLRSDFGRLGLREGEVLMVHSSVRAVGEVRGGVNVIVQALLDSLGPAGTLVAYLDFEPFFEDEDEEDVPVFAS